MTEKEGIEPPVHYWDPSIAPSGMVFYTGDRYPQWKGNLFVGALVQKHLARLVLDGDKVVEEQRLYDGAPASATCGRGRMAISTC